MYCADCKWWLYSTRESGYLAPPYDKDPQYLRGHCQKALPVVGIGWPLTGGYQFCGEFSEKETT